MNYEDDQQEFINKNMLLQKELQKSREEIEILQSKLQHYQSTKKPMNPIEKDDLETVKILHMKLNPVQIGVQRSQSLKDLKIQHLEDEITTLHGIVAETIQRTPSDGDYFANVVKNIVSQFKEVETHVGKDPISYLRPKISQNSIINPHNDDEHSFFDQDDIIQITKKAKKNMEDMLTPKEPETHSTFLISRNGNEGNSGSHLIMEDSPQIQKENNVSRKRPRLSLGDSEIYVQNADLRRKIDELERKLEEAAKVSSKLRDIFTNTTKEFRETVIQVLGYKVDIHPNHVIVRPAINYDIPKDQSRAVVMLRKRSSLRSGDLFSHEISQIDDPLLVQKNNFVLNLPDGVTKYLKENEVGLFFSALSFYLDQTYHVIPPIPDTI